MSLLTDTIFVTVTQVNHFLVEPRVEHLSLLDCFLLRRMALFGSGTLPKL